LLTTAQAVGFALGPGLGGKLSQTLGLSSPFLFSAAIALVASLLAVFPLVLGRLSESLPKKPLIVVVLAAPLYSLLLAGAALAGLGSALVEPAMGSIYLAATTDDTRGQIMGLRGSAISLAIMLGPLVPALIGPWITPQITFAIGVVVSVSMALVAFLLLINPRQVKQA
jgi:MFS family permease